MDVLGAVLRTVLFVGSTIFAETLTLAKYPENTGYQRTFSPSIHGIPRLR